MSYTRRYVEDRNQEPEAVELSDGIKKDAVKLSDIMHTPADKKPKPNKPNKKPEVDKELKAIRAMEASSRRYVDIKPKVRSGVAPAAPSHVKTFRVYLSSVDSKYHSIDSTGNDVALES